MLIPYRSGSRANVYEVWDGRSRILLECGANMKTLRSVCGRMLTEYAGCLVTHEHKDHSAGAKGLAKLGVHLWMSAGTADAVGLDGQYNIHRITDGRVLDVGGYKVRPFEVVHDAAQPLGFLIQSMHTGEKLVFATDTAYLRYTFGAVEEIAVECNYVKESLEASALDARVRERILRSHFELGRVVAWLGECDLSRTRVIWLLHLSGTHGNAAEFVRVVREATGIETRVAEV